MTTVQVPLAVVVPDEEGTSVVKVAPLRLVIMEGPGLAVMHDSAMLLIDADGPAEADRLSTMASEDDAGVVVSDSLTADPRPMGNRVAYEIRAEGRRIVWAPFATEIPAWAAGADLFFASPEIERGSFTGRLADATDVGTTYLLRRSSLVGRASKAVDEANPAGELQARHLIRWYERGEGAARIAWGTPGAFDRCVRIANDHMTTEQAQGFCFAGETEFLTADGPMTFAEAVDTDQLVLTAPLVGGAPGPQRGVRSSPVRWDGHWVQAPIRSYGEQRLLTVTIRRNRERRTIRATPEHIWFTSPGARSAARERLTEVTTAALHPGMSLASLFGLSQVLRSSPSPFGVAAGVIFGDGHREGNRGCRVDLWGDKDAHLLPYFAGCQQAPIKNGNGTLGVRVAGIPGSWKAAPALDEGVPYLMGWLAGYIAADGSVGRAGKVILYSSRREHLELAATVAARLGVGVYGIRSSRRSGFGALPTALYRMSFVARTVPPALLVLPEHRRRFEAHASTLAPVRWQVEAVEDLGEVEEVFCAEVPDTHTFALSGNVWVHNCANRHKGATGKWPGEAKKAGDDKPGLVAVLRDWLTGRTTKALSDQAEVDAETEHPGRTEKAEGVSQSAMVALYPSREVAEMLALDGGEDVDELHITLAYLGPDAVTKLADQRSAIMAAVAGVADKASPMSGQFNGLGRFTPGYPAGQDPWPLYASLDAPTLSEFRQRLVERLRRAGVEIATNHGFAPHLTLAYIEPEDEEAAVSVLAEGLEVIPATFDSVALVWGDERIIMPLGQREEPRVFKAQAGPVIKSDDAKRYTFAPMYPASGATPTLDAHGEFMGADDLQESVWDYVRAGDRSLTLQHLGDDAVIGEWVELVSWPLAVEVELTLPTGEKKTVSYAPGTVFMGVVWTPQGWEMVRKGLLRGFSLEGFATRVEVEVAA